MSLHAIKTPREFSKGDIFWSKGNERARLTKLLQYSTLFASLALLDSCTPISIAWTNNVLFCHTKGFI